MGKLLVIVNFVLIPTLSEKKNSLAMIFFQKEIYLRHKLRYFVLEN